MEKEIVKIWKERKVAYGNFEFYCGGDSMGDTTLTFHDNEGNTIEGDDIDSLKGYFEDEVYKNVDFYEASDGHYMGESGNVRIELTDDYDDVEDEDLTPFIYTKSARSEFSENHSIEKEVELTNEEANFLKEYVESMFSSSWDGQNINYKKDFFLTDEIQQIVEGLNNKFDSCEIDYEFPDNVEGEIADDSYGYNTDIDEDGTLHIFEVEGKWFIKISVTFQTYEYIDNED